MRRRTPLEFRLAALRERGRDVPVQQLAQTLLALTQPLDPETARRVIAPWLGCSEAELRAPLPVACLRRREREPDLGTAIEHAEFCVVDLETTGLSSAAGILEIGAVHVAGLRSVAHFETLVRPEAPIPWRISRLTGIEGGHVADAPALPEAWSAFRAWLSGACEAVPVAHNAGFDAGFLRRAGRALEAPVLPGPWLCTRQLGRRLLPELRRYALDDLCSRFGIPNAARHRALGDANATARLLVSLLRRARDRGAYTLSDLVELQAGKSPRLLRKLEARGLRPQPVARRGPRS